MGGIAGLILADGGAPPDARLPRMVEAMAPRGPDGAAIRSEGSASFAHLRLVTTPEAARDTLPLRRGDLLLTADARLDNREELARALDADPSVADGEILALAYERWGERCVEHLLGDFAFAIRDARRRTLFCARDALGMKPLFYLSTGALFAFASEIKALSSLEEVPRRLNEEMARDFLLALPGDESATLYKGIHRLPAAHVLTLAEGGRPITRPYWHLDPARELPVRTDAEHVEEFRTVFEEAVRCRLRSASPLGATLSGGLDSSAVVCVARTLLPPKTPLLTFSLRFPDVPECDEGPFIEAVRQGGDLVAHDITGDARTPLQDIDDVLARFDEPCLVQNLHHWWALYGHASRLGVRAILDGHDGDTAVSHGRAGRVPPAKEGLHRRLARAAASPRDTLGRLGERLRGAAASTPAAPPPDLLQDDFARRTNARDRVESFRRARREAEAQGERRIHLHGLTSGYTTYASETSEKLGAAFGIEPRHPFYDRRVLELCLALPVALKRSGGFTRNVVRDALSSVLPEVVRGRRGKTDLAPQFHRGFGTGDGERIERAIAENRGRLEPFVDLKRLEECRRGYVEAPDGAASVRLFSAVTFALWLGRTRLSD